MEQVDTTFDTGWRSGGVKHRGSLRARVGDGPANEEAASVARMKRIDDILR